MNILINGCAGGIGSALTEYLYKKGHKIIGVDNFSNGYRENVNEDYCEFHVGDCGKDIASWVLGNYKVDAVIILNAISSLPQCELNPVECFKQNTLKVAEILEECRRYKVSNICFASSSSVYEGNTEPILTENLLVKPTLAYPLSKKMAEDICLSYMEKYGMNISILRFFNVANQKSDLKRLSPPLINYIVKQIILNKPVQLHSNSSRDYISVDKVNEAIEACINQKAYGIFNICSGKTITVNQIFETVSTALEYKEPPIYNHPENLWKNYGLTIKKELVVKEVNKTALGSNAKFYNQLGINLNENSLEKISEIAKEIYNNYNGKL